MVTPLLDLPRLAWSAPDLRQLIPGATVVAQIDRRVRLVKIVDGTAVGKPASGGPEAEWELIEDHLVRLDEGALAVIDPASGKPRHQVAVPGARRIVRAGSLLFAWGKPEIRCLVARDGALAVMWSAPCDHVNRVFSLGDCVVVADVRSGKGRTRMLALADGHELRTMPGSAVLADELGLVFDVGGAFVVTAPDGATKWRGSYKQFQPLALLGDVLVATQTRPDLLAGPVVILDRATGRSRATVPEAEPARRVFPDGPTQKIVAVADDTIYLAEGVRGRAQPVTALDANGQPRWTFDVTIGAGHHINSLYAAEHSLLGWAGSGRAFCLVAG